jgi:hypothetical protein
MKIAIECRSPLLQKSLENFLEGHLSSSKNCDLLLSDELLLGRDNVLRIGSDSSADIMKPFSKSQLFLKLEHYYKIKEDAVSAMHIAQELDMPVVDAAPVSLDETDTVSLTMDTLENKIERLTASYVEGVMSLVKEYRGQ